MNKDIERIRAIADPEQRARAAARAWALADAAVSQARAQRDAACLHLLRNEGWKPIQVYTLAGLSRRLFGPIAASRKGPAPVVEDAEKIAKRAGKRFWEQKARLDEVAAIRAAAGHEMLAAARSNADVARATNLSTARITQMRKGLR